MCGVVAGGLRHLPNFVVGSRAGHQLSTAPSPFFTGIETWAFLSLSSHRYLPVYLEYSPNLTAGSWISAGAVFPDSTGSISVTLKSLGNKVADWKKGLFFRVKNP